MDQINNNLHVPLLYDNNSDDCTDSSSKRNQIDDVNKKVNDEVVVDNDDNTRAVWFICSVKVQEEEEVDDDEDDDVEKNIDENENESNTTKNGYCMKMCWNVLISAILPVLLYFQFYVTIHNQSDTVYDVSDDLINADDWKSIQYSIFLFVVTSILYRITMMYDFNTTASDDTGDDDSHRMSYYELFLHLLPDIVINVLLILILFQQTIIALLFMQVSTIVFAFVAVLNSFGCYSGTSCSIRISTTSSTIDGDEYLLDEMVDVESNK